MDDQANDLRRLARQGLATEAPGQRQPRLVLITSGKGGVGTTTMAIGVAAATARLGHATVLVDANPHGGDVAVLCRLSERRTLADLILARCRLDEALEEGPGGMRVLPGAWGQDVHEEYSAAAQQRLIEQLRGLGPAADYVVIDAGCGSGRVLRRFWQAADAVMVVTTPEITSVMDSYASIKLLVPASVPPAVLSLVNQAPSKAAAEDVQRRLERACRRFLGLGLLRAGHVSPQAQAAAAVRAGAPLALLAGACGREITAVVDAVLAIADGASAPANWEEPLRNPLRMTA